ncbi:TPA: hypothetical protein UOJ00_002985 [Stenotrophomonas maltophilia]|nr:hypothetical protein [Stenotrophomonas maltophilia]
MNLFKKYRFVTGFFLGAFIALAAGLTLAAIVIPTPAENTVEELVQFTSSILDDDGQRKSPEKSYAAHVFVVDQLTIAAGRLYSSIRSDRLRSILHSQVAIFAKGELSADPDFAGRLDPTAQAVRECVLNEADEAKRKACLADIRFTPTSSLSAL